MDLLLVLLLLSLLYVFYHVRNIGGREASPNTYAINTYSSSSRSSNASSSEPGIIIIVGKDQS